MKTTLDTHEIATRLSNDEFANFSWDGAKALAEYLEELEADTGEEIEFDACGIRCDFSEYETLVEWADEFFGDFREDLDIGEDELDEEEIDEKIREFIRDNGQLIEFSGGIIVSAI